MFAAEEMRVSCTYSNFWNGNQLYMYIIIRFFKEKFNNLGTKIDFLILERRHFLQDEHFNVVSRPSISHMASLVCSRTLLIIVSLSPWPEPGSVLSFSVASWLESTENWTLDTLYCTLLTIRVTRKLDLISPWSGTFLIKWFFFNHCLHLNILKLFSHQMFHMILIMNIWSTVQSLS